MFRRLPFAFAALLVCACTDVWSAHGPDGIPFAAAEAGCREQARASALRQLPSPYDRFDGPAGVPAISRHDIEERETARCLLDRGFTLTRR